MAVKHLDHFTLRTALIDETVTFFRDAIGLEEGWRPAFPFPGRWLYSQGRPVVHIANLAVKNLELEDYLGSREIGSGGGSLDHISFRCENLSEHQNLLVKLGLQFQERIVPELSEHQLFVDDPNGIRIELIFPYSPDNSVIGDDLGRLDIKAT